MTNFTRDLTPEDQFETDVLALRPALTAFALRFCRKRYDADDLVQETLFRAFRYRDYYEPGTKLRSWMFTIMRNVFYSQCVKRRREPVVSDEFLDMLPASAPRQEWSLYELDAQRLINELPDHQRVALVQVCAGTSYEATARSLGCEIGTIKSRVARARRTLMAGMGEIFTSHETYAR